MQQGFRPLLDIDERQPFAQPPNSDYGRAKMLAEQALVQAWRETPACELLILRPTFVWGPGVPAVEQLVDKVRRGQFSWIDHGQAPFERVHVDNLARAIELATHAGRPGGHYLITDGVRGTVRSSLAPLIAATGTTVGLLSGIGVPSATSVELSNFNAWASYVRRVSAGARVAVEDIYIGCVRRADDSLAGANAAARRSCGL